MVVEEEGVIGGVRLETEREAMKREVQRRMNRMKAEAEGRCDPSESGVDECGMRVCLFITR